MNDLDNTLRLLPLEEIHESDFTNEYIDIYKWLY